MQIHYFVKSLSSQGYVSFEENNLSGINTIRLKGYPHIVLKSIFGTLNSIAREKKLDTHIIHNCLDNSEEGIIFPQIKTAVINTPVYDDKSFDIHRLFDNEKLSNIKKHLSRALSHYKEALIIHDEWEKYYIDNTDFKKLEELAKKFTEENIPQREGFPETIEITRFFGSATAGGTVDYIENLTEDIKKRYFIKGRPGSGKSTFLKTLAQNLCKNGYDAECYRCALSPVSYDMVICRNLDFAVFDSTPPHEYFPTRKTDEILDFYAIAIKPDTDILYKDKLMEISGRYKHETELARLDLQGAKEYWDKISSIYLSAVNYDKLKDEEERIRNMVF